MLEVREDILGLGFLVLGEITKPTKPNTFGMIPNTFGIVPKYLVTYQRCCVSTPQMHIQNVDARDLISIKSERPKTISKRIDAREWF